MKLSTFLLVSTVGRLPGTYLLTMQGAKFRSEEYYEVMAFGVVSVICVIVAFSTEVKSINGSSAGIKTSVQPGPF